MSDIFPEVTEGKPDGEQPLHFYYNREERIAHAPQSVKDYYAGKMEPVKGFKVLFLKQNRFVLIALILFVAFTWIYTGFNKSRNYVKIQDLSFELQAFSFDGEIFSNLKLYDKKSREIKIPQNVEVQIFFVNNDNQIFEKQEETIVYSGQEEYLRTKITDYDIIRIDAIVSYKGEEKELSAFVQR